MTHAVPARKCINGFIREYVMEWSRLLSRERPGDYGKSAKQNHDLRSEFEKDYHRIIGSASFRRLQDKTQVFPLDKSDFIRTRLTHSLEVSSFGRSLGENVSAEILTQKLDPSFTLETKEDICEILQCAGLIHDIGNPPFGHFGEESIREWFRSHMPRLSYHGKPVMKILTPQMAADLMNFEGNAQALRLVGKLHFLVNEYGMNLTYALLSTILKYPVSSLEISPSSGNVAEHKMGYFLAEEELFRKIQESTGTQGCRNPLTYLLEAADDIAYATADIEDAFKKGFFDYDTFRQELKKRRMDEECIGRLEELYERGTRMKVPCPQEYAVMNFLIRMQGQMLRAAADGFISHYATIMKGGYPHEIFYHTPGEKIYAALTGIAHDYAFTSSSIYKTEIAANGIVTYLLNHLVPAAIAWDGENDPGLMEEKFLSLISENYRQVYRNSAKGKDAAEKLYLRLLLVTDSVSGMTDSYARDLYRDLNGLT